MKIHLRNKFAFVSPNVMSRWVHKEQNKVPKSTLSLAQIVLRKEPLSFYRGFGLSFIRQGSLMPVVMLAKVPLGRWLTSGMGGPRNVKNEAFANSIGAISASAMCSFLCTPLDTLKIRLQADSFKKSEKRRYTGTLDAMRTFVSRHGVSALWAGSMPTVLLRGVYYGVGVPAYEVFKASMISLGRPDTASTHVTSSVLSVLLANCITQPLDVIKTKLMNQSPSNPKYRNSLDCGVKLVEASGVKGLFTGFAPRFLRNGPWQVIFFVTYEQCMALVNKTTLKDD